MMWVSVELCFRDILIYSSPQRGRSSRAPVDLYASPGVIDPNSGKSNPKLAAVKLIPLTDSRERSCKYQTP